MTGKEALERIKNIELHHIEYEIDDYYDNDYVFEKSDGTIEENYTDEIKVIEKDLQVLNIIKEKRVDVHYFMSCETLEEYNEDALSSFGFYDDDYEERRLTLEEYDLLKERLGR